MQSQCRIFNLILFLLPLKRKIQWKYDICKKKSTFVLFKTKTNHIYLNTNNHEKKINISLTNVLCLVASGIL